MNKEQDIDNQLYKYLSPDLYCYVHNYIVDLKNANNQLTNNWNALEEWLNEQQEFLKDTPVFMGEIYFEHKTMNNTYQNVLDKMEEIKDGNK